MWNRILNYISSRLKKEEKPADKNSSRKYRFIIYVFLAATVMCLFPPLISVLVFKLPTPLVVLGGGEWVTVISMLGGFYFGANVIQKRLLKQTEVSTPDPKTKPEITIDNDQ